MVLTFENWQLKAPAGKILARENDNLTARLEVQGDLPAGWTWHILFRAGEGEEDILPTTPVEGGVSHVLDEAHLPRGGYYSVQLRGTLGEQTKRTNIVSIYVAESICSGNAKWPTIPTAFSEMERRMTDLSTHPPIPGEDGNWMLWDADKGEYAASDIPLPEGTGEGGNNIPDYWEHHLAEKINSIKRLQRAGGKDCYSFIVMADFHHPSNADYSPALIKRVIDACNIRYCLCLGDIQSGAALTKLDEVEEGWEEIHDIFAPIRDFTLFTAGNHDGAWGRYDKDGSGNDDQTDEYYVYNFTREEIYDYIFRSVSKIPGVIFNDSGDAYYVDDTAAKARYLLLNSHWAVYEEDANGCAINNFMRKARLGQSQQDFAAAALNSVPADDWTVVVGCHMPIASGTGWGDGGGGDLSLFRNMLIAYQNKETFSGTYGAVGDYDHVTLDVDFTASKGRIVGAFSGHMHNDLLLTDYAFPILAVAADNHTSFKAIDGGGVAAPGELGTITEQSFDVITVNKREGVLYATKIGKGSDRVISLGEALVVTMDLRDATASNTALAVEKNSSYTNTLTANIGYAIDSVIVTMGGVDITASAYSNGIISIDNVTGNIAITVVTSYRCTNLADPTSDDWINSPKSLGDGVFEVSEGAYPNIFVTNYVPITQYDLIRFKGVELEIADGLGTDPSMWFYDEDKAYVTRIRLPAAKAGTSSGLPTNVVMDENGVVAYTILLRGDTGEQFVYKDMATRAKYVRIHANRTGAVEDVIITVNEEIV